MWMIVLLLNYSLYIKNTFFAKKHFYFLIIFLSTIIKFKAYILLENK